MSDAPDTDAPEPVNARPERVNAETDPAVESAVADPETAAAAPGGPEIAQPGRWFRGPD
jgi:hypothetical protein